MIVSHKIDYFCLFNVSLAMTFVLVLASTGCASTKIERSGTETFSFALIGDVPYDGDNLRFERLIAEVNADDAIEWVLHAGDIKSGASSCSDAYLEGRRAWFDRFEVPFILTPGDNEWTDCHRATAGGYEPLERLAALRRIFYPTPGHTIGGLTMPVTSQAGAEGFTEFPENVMWERGGVVFATLHIVGSRNGLLAFPGRTEADDREVQRRMAAAVAWLDQVFDRARANRSGGVFLAMHANPGFEAYRRGSPDAAFQPFLNALSAELTTYTNPVILAHGDTHYFRIDKPLIDLERLERRVQFTRVETFGGGDVHWLRVTVDVSYENIFSIRQEIVIP